MHETIKTQNPGLKFYQIYSILFENWKSIFIIFFRTQMQKIVRGEGKVRRIRDGEGAENGEGEVLNFCQICSIVILMLVRNNLALINFRKVVQ